MAKTLTNKMAREWPFAKSGQETVQDSTPGFFMRVGKRRKVYAWQTEVTRLGERKPLKGTIGKVEDFDVDDARIEALKEMKLARTSGNGSKPGTLTLRMVWAAYAKRSMRPTTLHNYRDNVERVLAPWLDTPMRDLSEDAQGVKARHEEITRKHGRAGNPRGGQATANAAMKVLRTLYRFARKTRMEAGLPSDMPTDAVEMHVLPRRNTGMAQDELASWAWELSTLPNPIRRAFHKFTLLSGSRPNALRQCEWTWFDEAAKTLSFPGSVMKSGRDFILPLSGPMIMCLEEARAAGQRHPRQGERYIFPSQVGCLVHTKERRNRLSKYGNDLRQTWVNASKEVHLGYYEERRLLDHKAADVHDAYGEKLKPTLAMFEAQERVSAYLETGLKQ